MATDAPTREFDGPTPPCDTPVPKATACKIGNEAVYCEDLPNSDGEGCDYYSKMLWDCTPCLQCPGGWVPDAGDCVACDEADKKAEPVTMWADPVKKPGPPSPAPTIDDYVTTAEQFAASYDTPPPVAPTAVPSPSPTAAPTATPTFKACPGPDCEEDAKFAAVWDTAPTPNPTATPTSPTAAPTFKPTASPTAAPTAEHYHDGSEKR